MQWRITLVISASVRVKIWMAGGMGYEIESVLRTFCLTISTRSIEV